ncbi:MAG: YbaB/EbfC family nucleoid-associated protein [Syntrophaceticus sp.]
MMSVPELFGMAQNIIKLILKKLEKQMDGKEIEGVSGNGAVRIVISSKIQVLEVKIDPHLACNVEQLEELVGAAVDDALQKGSGLLKSEVQKILGDL